MKLLRVLQSGEVKPVGSDTSKIVDVRVVAATNVDLKAAIAAGTFRQDLFYRLNVIAVRLPALRERGDDLLLLAHHFIQKHAQLAGRPATHLSNEAALLIQSYDWPGNVRELEHAIEHAVVLSQEAVIQPNSLPAELLNRSSEVPSSTSSMVMPRSSQNPVSGAFGASFATGAFTGEGYDAAAAGARTMVELVNGLGLAQLAYPEAKKRVLAEFNDAYVGALLKSTTGNMSEAARRSGLDRSNFRRLVRTTAVEAGAASTRNPSNDDDS